MKKSLVYTAVLTAIFTLSGCGSDDTERNNQNTNQNSNNGNNNTTLTEAQRQKVLAVSQETTPIIVKEALISGVVDSLIYGVDEADADEKCISGSYSRTGDVLTFDDCKGLFKTATGLNQSQNLTASGQVTVKEGGYEYKDLVLLDADSGESKTANGTLNFLGSDTTSVVTTDKLTIKATEKTATAFADVTYLLESYKLNYDKKSGSELSLTTRGTLTATNSTVGDYQIKFETTQPLFVQIDSKKDDAVVSYPYDGVVTIQDVSNGGVTTITANNDKKTARLSVTANGKELANGTQTWEEILGH